MENMGGVVACIIVYKLVTLESVILAHRVRWCAVPLPSYCRVHALFRGGVVTVGWSLHGAMCNPLVPQS
jgi:hypothetical protein